MDILLSNLGLISLKLKNDSCWNLHQMFVLKGRRSRSKFVNQSRELDLNK
jgi:hypothetical protein